MPRGREDLRSPHQSVHNPAPVRREGGEVSSAVAVEQKSGYRGEENRPSSFPRDCGRKPAANAVKNNVDSGAVCPLADCILELLLSIIHLDQEDHYLNILVHRFISIV